LQPKSSEALRGVGWHLLTEVAGLLIGPVFKGQAVQEYIVFERIRSEVLANHVKIYYIL